MRRQCLTAPLKPKENIVYTKEQIEKIKQARIYLASLGVTAAAVKDIRASTKAKNAVPEYTYEQVMAKIKEGTWEAENDVVKGKTITIIKYPSKARIMVRVKDKA